MKVPLPAQIAEARLHLSTLPPGPRREVAALIGEAAALIEQQESVIASLVEALEPFCEAAEVYEPEEDDDQAAAWQSVFDIGDLRKARAAFNASKNYRDPSKP